MLQSQLAVKAAAGVNGTLDMFVESNDTNGLQSHSPSSPPQRKRGRPRMDESDKRPRKSYVSIHGITCKQEHPTGWSFDRKTYT